MKAFLQAQIEVVLCASILFAGIAATHWYPQIMGVPSPNQRLLCALDQNNETEIAAALSEGASPTACDSDGGTALMHAAISGNLRVARELLARGATVNAVDRFGNDALICATRAQRTQLIAFLLAAGADPQHRNMLGDNAIAVAKYWQANEIVAILQKYT